MAAAIDLNMRGARGPFGEQAGSKTQPHWAMPSDQTGQATRSHITNGKDLDEKRRVHASIGRDLRTVVVA